MEPAPTPAVAPNSVGHLLLYGFAVYRNVLPRGYCENVRQQLAQVQSHYRVQQGSRTTLLGITNDGINKVDGHHPAMWSLRGRPEVARVAADLLQIADIEGLRVSFDGFCYSFKDLATDKDSYWPHFDVGTRATEINISVQMQVILSPNEGPGDGGLVVWPGSNHRHAWCMQQQLALIEQNVVKTSDKKLRNNWVKPHESIVAQLGDPVCVGEHYKVQPGDVVAWLSTCLHMYQPPKRSMGSAGVDRCVAYLSYVPKQCLTRKDIENRWWALRESITTSHWAGWNCVKLNPRTPHLYNKEAEQLWKQVAANVQYPKPLEQMASGSWSPLAITLSGWNDDFEEKRDAFFAKKMAGLSKLRATLAAKKRKSPPISLGIMRPPPPPPGEQEDETDDSGDDDFVPPVAKRVRSGV